MLDCMQQLKPEYQDMLEAIAQSILKTQTDQQAADDFMSGNKNNDQADDWWPEGQGDD